LEWQENDLQKFKKLNTLIKDALRNPFRGIGKPEALKYNNKKYWSRRISSEHRLIYKVTEESIIVVSCKGHYK
jgi:toxin YoeB